MVYDLSYWKTEILALMVNFASMAALITLLAAYDRKYLFDWHGITLNTLVSVISTAAKAPIVFVVAESISQWKWIIFTQNRLLLDFQSIDAASRGPWGSLKLFWRCRKDVFLQIGALTTILAIAVDPFTQQLVQFGQGSYEVESSQVRIPRAYRYAKGSRRVINVMRTTMDGISFPTTAADADFSLQAAVLYGLTHSFNDTLRQTSFLCPSGNCSWDPFQSLAVCSTCSDLSSILQKREAARNSSILAQIRGSDPTAFGKTTVYELPNGHSIDGYDLSVNGSRTWMTSFGTGNPAKTVSLQEKDTLIWGMSILRWNEGLRWENATVDAIECGLYYCGIQYTSSVINGTLHEEERLISDAIRAKNSFSPQDRDGYADLESINELDSLQFSPGPSSIERTDLMLGQDFNISQEAVNSISSFFNDSFTDSFTSGLGSLGMTGYLRWQGDYEPSTMQAFVGIEDLRVPFQAMARSMSNMFREGDEGVSVEHGRMVLLNTYHIVKWPWIILHCVFIVSGTVFLLITIRRTNKLGVPVWTSNSIAVLSVGGKVSNDLKDADTAQMLEKKARETSNQLLTQRTVLVGVDKDPENAVGESNEELLLEETDTTHGRSPTF